ncbi:carbonic anhydrase family protein [Lacipirellula parvula]|uniref:Na-dependent bicarbonate transporter BicA n=1 Tax=Lacipirellula parvula TaxID=2650471 RepID=A0A5K7XBH5_9BACT|nr:carbonic anhydrase family protein [Lacipirellula parvula]BBO34150.1 na-dependent bicarbonate transporter BicA [Lacipirellula parvula]
MGRDSSLFTRNRRGFLGCCGAVAAAGTVGATAAPAMAYDALTREQRDKMTPDDVIALVKAGNMRFRTGERQERNFLREQISSSTGQFPAAVLLSCIDSRAPAEIILDMGIGDTFNARIAGNVINDDILGSMEFSCAVVGAKLVLVMGHTSCGAVAGAIDDVELGYLTGLLGRIKPAVAKTEFTGERTGKNPAFVDAVARTNVLREVAQIRAQSEILHDLEQAGKIKIVGSMYDIKTGAVEFLG